MCPDWLIRVRIRSISSWQSEHPNERIDPGDSGGGCEDPSDVRRRCRAAESARLHLEVRPHDEQTGELLPRIYLSVAGSGRLQLFRLRARRWRSADVLVVPARRYRPAVGLPGVR